MAGGEVQQPTAEDYMNALNNQAAFAAAAAAQQQQQQQLGQQTQQLNSSAAANMALPTRRKKATAKKNLQQQQQQQQTQQLPQQTFAAQPPSILQQQIQAQFIAKGGANPQLQHSTDGTQTVGAMGIDLNDPRMEVFASATKQFIGNPGIVENLGAFADLDLSKVSKIRFLISIFWQLSKSKPKYMFIYLTDSIPF